jgi:hypothetical protein
MTKQSLVVNLFGGPGSGKSTTAAGIFFDLKSSHVECELASEIAKEYVWQHRDYTFNDQIYLFAKQHHRIFCLLGQVDVIITDCPILLTPVYDTKRRKTLEQLVVDEHKSMVTHNVFIQRVKPYNANGRLKSHDEITAKKLDSDIMAVLNKHDIPFESVTGNIDGKNSIVNQIIRLIPPKKYLTATQL